MMIPFLMAGMILGLSAGFSPGPLLTLVISHSLRHGTKEGIKVAVAPLITDLPIILFSLFVLRPFANSRAILGIFSLIGCLFVLYLAYENFRAIKQTIPLKQQDPHSLRKAILVNTTNPHPYLFWFSLGAPMIIKAWGDKPFTAILFMIGFYGCLVGSKVFTATLIHKVRKFLMGKKYLYLMRVMGGLLILFALILFKDGIKLLWGG